MRPYDPNAYGPYTPVNNDQQFPANNYYAPQSSGYINQHTFIPEPMNGPSVHHGHTDSSSIPTYNFLPTSPVTDMAMEYSSNFVGQGAQFVQKNVKGYISNSGLKYYFAVNNSYVARKLGLILFPFAHTKWTTEFDPSGPVPPGDDVNAPDLYIPIMAFLTYVLASGAIMGFQSRFSPEQLGILSSEALSWVVLEVLVSFFFIYIFNIQSNVSYLDLVAFSGYKFVSMLVVLFAYLIFQLSGYYFTLIYVSVSLAFLLIRTLKLKLLPHAEAYPSEGNKRRVYLLLVIALVQPVLIWWLTRRIVSAPGPVNVS